MLAHNCGYQGGVRAFQSMAGVYGVAIPDEQAQGIVNAWRGRHPAVTDFWRGLRRAAFDCVEENTPGVAFHAGRVSFLMQRGHMWCVLPSGRRLCYPFPRIADVARPQSAIDADIAAGVNPTEIRTHTRAVVYQTRENRAGRRKQWTEVQLYGGLLAENATQAVARDVLVAGLRECERAGWTVVGHVHDEALVEADKGRDAAGLKRAMLTLPSWAAGLPVDAAADGPLVRYRK